LIFWRGGRIFDPTKYDFKTHENMISKKERHRIAFLKKRNKESGLNLISLHDFGGLIFPPQIGECQYLITYRDTYKTTSVIF
jgi:hypothetical protein